MTAEQGEAVIVGSGPNGLAAAITLAQAGRKVRVLEGKDKVGGGLRSAHHLTLPGFIHDPCSAIHPLGIASPFFRQLPLKELGVRWVFPPYAAAHPLDDGTAMLVGGRVETTAAQFGRDARAYRLLMEPIVAGWRQILDEFLGPLRVPHHPLMMARFGAFALLPATVLARLLFREERTRAVFAGLAAHSIMPLEQPATSAFGLMLGMVAHAIGWPMAQGGSEQIADALELHLRRLGGHIEVNREVQSVEEFSPRQAVLFDVTPRQLLRLAGSRLPEDYRRGLEDYRYGAGVFKVDYALDGPIPWRANECLKAGTVHVGGSLDDIAASEAAVGRGQHPERPFLILAQQSLFDPTRAGRQAHRVDLLPHAQWLDRGHDRGDREPDRTLRTGLSQPHPGSGHSQCGRDGAVQSELCGRRHQWWRPGSAPALYAAHSKTGSLRHACQRHLHLFFGNPTGRGGTRHVRLLRRPIRAAP